jgi:hypothetical protein
MRLAELDRPGQAEPAHVAHDVELVNERPRPFEQPPAEPGALLHEALLAQLVQCREAGRHRELVRREGGAVRHRMRHRVEDRFVHRAGHEERTRGDVASGEGLGQRDEVRLEPPVLEGEHPARAAEAGHHLVDAEERPVAAAELLGSREVAVRREVDALALHRLNEEERHVFSP